MILIWIAVALIFGVVEVATTAFFAAFVVAGAVTAVVVASAGQGAISQTSGFIVVSLLGILVARPWLLRRLRRRPSVDTVSGARAMIGEVAKVVDLAGGLGPHGHVRILGEDWPCVTGDGSILTRGTYVRIIDIEKATLLVERAEPVEASLGRVAPPPGAS
jgi:membrane protein implicated in regulation of membrane protease activity